MTRKMTKMKFAKTDTRYWERKVGFQTPASRTFSVQIQHANRRMIIGLGTANRAQAAFEARQLYVALKANGWDETMRRRRGDVAREEVRRDDWRIPRSRSRKEPPAASRRSRATPWRFA